MRNILAISTKELKSYFASPMAYVITAVYLVITGYFFSMDLTAQQEATIRGFLFPGSFLLLLLAPILTMRLLAEEQKLGTIELLLTSPVRDAEVVLGKFLSSLAILAVMLALTLYYPMLLFWFGDPDPGPIASGYLATLLLGSAFLAVGLLASSLTSNQIVAAVVSFGILVIFWMIQSAANLSLGIPGEIFNYLSLPGHFTDMAWGIIDTKDVIYYLAFTTTALFLAVRSLETRRWR